MREEDAGGQMILALRVTNSEGRSLVLNFALANSILSNCRGANSLPSARICEIGMKIRLSTHYPRVDKVKKSAEPTWTRPASIP